MPSEERIAEFAEAALRIVARDGLAAVSFRAVATESGWSLGAVQRAFASNHDLLAATLARAQHEGELAVTVDRDRLARSILALASGLAAQLLYDPMTDDEAAATLDQAVAGLLTGSPGFRPEPPTVPAAVDPGRTGPADRPA